MKNQNMLNCVEFMQNKINNNDKNHTQFQKGNRRF